MSVLLSSRYFYILLVLVLCVCGNGIIDPSRCQESDMTQACRGEFQTKHAFYFYPKLWSDTLHFNVTHLRQCLDARPRWIQFMGDSTLRYIYLELVAQYYDVYIDHLNNKVPHEMTDRTTNVSWVFKGKFMRTPYAHLESLDVNNDFLRNMSIAQKFPDAIVFAIGAHELMTWSGRKQPTLSVETFMQDTNDFLDFLEKYEFFNKTQVYFVNMNSLRGWRFSLEELGRLRDYACEEQKYACEAFKARGARVLDLYSISNPYADLADKPGVHYKVPVLTEQVKAIIYDMCKREGLVPKVKK